jgi:hypothetical protein
MNKVLVFLCAVLLCGCSSASKRGASGVDAFETVRIDQMTGNNVSGMVFQRTLFCLNARRETRRVSAMTNQVVSFHTNRVVSWTTNVYSASSTNAVSTLATNQLTPPPPAGPVVAASEEPGPKGSIQPAAEPTTNSVLTRTADTAVTTSSGNYQAAVTVNTQSSLAFNNQITTTHSNLAISTLSSQLVRTESNQTVTCITNLVVTPLTNQVIISTNLLIHDDYLYTEVTPPPDFSLAPGESLVLLVDSTRYAFAPTNTSAAAFGRRGFVCTLYKVPPEVLVAIANAHEVRIRLRGVSSNIERKMSGACRKRFRKFLLKYYIPEGANAEWPLRSLDSKPAPAPSPSAPST